MKIEEKVEMLEKKVNELETQLMNTLELLKEAVKMSRGLSNEQTEYLVDSIYNVQQYVG